MLDLELEHALSLNTATSMSGDQQLSVGHGNLDVSRIDAGQLDDRDHGGNILTPVQVDSRKKAATAPDRARQLPEIVEEIVHVSL